MPEQWEREIVRLNDVIPPAGLRRRVDQGPSGDRMPPMPGRRQRLTAALVAIGVFVAAAGFAYAAFRGNGSVPLDGDSISPQPSAPAGALQLQCTSSGPEVLTPVVRTREDGVHVRIVDAGSAGDVLFGIGGWDRVAARAGEDLASGSFVRPLFVGDNFVACVADEERLPAPPAEGWVGFEVVDAEPSNWTSVMLPCPTTDWEAFSAQVSAPNEADLLDSDLAMRLPQVRPSDVVEPAGYILSPTNRTVRIVREGAVLAWLTATGPDSSATWTFSGTTCAGSDWFDHNAQAPA